MIEVPMFFNTHNTRSKETHEEENRRGRGAMFFLFTIHKRVWEREGNMNDLKMNALYFPLQTTLQRRKG